MKTVTTISLDIAKSVFQVHGIDAAGKRHGGIHRGRAQTNVCVHR